jgi:hypothetical protein
MSLAIEKNEKNISIRDDGKYVFEHVLVQTMEQSNINAIVESNKFEKEIAEEFVKNYEQKLEETKKAVLEQYTIKKNEAQEFINSITEENKTEIALKMLDDIILSKQKIIDTFDESIKKQYAFVDKLMLPQKLEQEQKKIDAEKTLEVWGKYYKELNDNVDA